MKKIKMKYTWQIVRAAASGILVFYREYLCGYGYLKRYLEPKRSCNIPKQNRAQQTQDRYRDKRLLWEHKLMMPHPRNPAKTPEYQLSYSQRFDDAPPESCFYRICYIFQQVFSYVFAFTGQTQVLTQQDRFCEYKKQDKRET